MKLIDSKQACIWVVDDDPINLTLMSSHLEKSGYHIRKFDSGRTLLEAIKRSYPDLILLDIRMPDLDGYDVCQTLKENEIWAEIPVIFMTALAEVEDKIRGFNVGAVDYVTKPMQYAEVLARVNTHLNLRILKQKSEAQFQEIQEKNKFLHEKESQIKSLQKTLAEIRRYNYNESGIIGKSPQIKKIIHLIHVSADTDANVLVTGETGTGKELIARAMHTHSDREKHRFVPINCSAIPDNLIESELFGYEPGAFTGAVKHKQGKFEYANGGSLFLDEIGELPLNLQAKLLRVLQDRTIIRLGGNKEYPIDVRIIAATNQNLQDMIQQGRFRQDLFYRLHVITIHIPPLRERKEDILLLTMHFIQKYNKLYNKTITRISESFARFLQSQTWNGNVRELENTIERFVVLNQSSCLDFQNDLLDEAPSSEHSYAYSSNYSLKWNMEQFEKALIKDTLKRHQGSIQDAASDLEIDAKTLYRKMKKYSINKDQFH